jgi:hypothetical protein
MGEECHKIPVESIRESMLTYAGRRCTLYLIAVGEMDGDVPDPPARGQPGKSWLSQVYGEPP